MKINRMTQNYTGIQNKVSLNKGADTPKDQVTLGGRNDDLGIMERPLVSMKSNTGDIGEAILKGLGIAGGAGIAAAAAGIAGKTLGGGMGVAIATGASAIIGGAVLGKFMAGEGDINVAGFATGAATMGILSAAGAGLSTVGSPWMGHSLAAITGAVGGAGAGMGGLLLFNAMHH